MPESRTERIPDSEEHKIPKLLAVSQEIHFQRQVFILSLIYYFPFVDKRVFTIP